MYPFIRIFYAALKARKSPQIGLFETHISHHYCMPWDIDLWAELNNGRTLTLYDLGRIPMSIRNGTAQAAKSGGFGMVVAGASVRYRKRITMGTRLEIHSRPLGFDDKFFYVEQSMWRPNGECANHILIRGAIVKKGKMVSPIELLSHIDIDPNLTSPTLPDWVQAWICADQERPWPPEPAP
jgi:acyl-CoA thioesterase FadM